MTSSRVWLGAAVLTLFAACGDDPAPPRACVPSCREGFTCVAGACLSACNPACGASERCDTNGAAPRCVTDDAGAGDAAPDVPPVDKPSPADVPAMDTPSPDVVATDVPAASDAPGADATEAPSPDVLDAAAPEAGTDAAMDVRADVPADTATTDASPSCGMTGQPCCGRTCVVGNVCEVPLGGTAGTCRAFSRRAEECARSEDCTAPAQCRPGLSCGERPCNLCQSVPMPGTRAFGQACTDSAECASGFCFQARCSWVCAPGAAGDAACATRGPGAVCGAVTTTITVAAGDGGVARTVSLAYGACRQGCARDAACAAGDLCLAVINDPLDRIDLVCRRGPTASGDASPAFREGGALCDRGDQCYSGVCLSLAQPRCFRACVTDADCPSAAPACVDFTWIRPSGGTQPGRACATR